MHFRTLLAMAAGMLALAAACGGGGREATPASPTAGTPPPTSGGSVVAGAFMTFDGRLYQAQDVGTDLVSLDDVELAGTTDQIDIDHTGPVEVYRPRDGASDALYTFQPGPQSPGEEGGPTPDVWLAWAPVEGQPGEGGSSEPGGAGGGLPAEPVATPGNQGPPQPAPRPTLSPDDVVSATPIPDADITPGTTVGPLVLAEKARAHLAQRLGVSADAIEVASVVQEWLPHQSCLNLEPGAACIQIAVDGYRVALSAQGVQYAYYAYPGDGQVYPAP